MEVEATCEAPVEAVKKARAIRSDAQLQQLAAARQRALALRADRKALRAAEPEAEEAEPQEDETVEYVRRARSKPKKPKRRVIVVEESSSEEEELEIRLPKKRPVAPEQSARDARLQRLSQKMFSL